LDFAFVLLGLAIGLAAGLVAAVIVLWRARKRFLAGLVALPAAIALVFVLGWLGGVALTDLGLMAGPEFETLPADARQQEGDWRLNGDRLCIDRAFDMATGCYSLFKDGDGYAMARDDGRIIWSAMHQEDE